MLLAGGLILGISVLLFVQRRRYPFLLMGWPWFVGMLVPVIGLVQTGGQAMAERHTYIPSLGVLILAIWGAYELTRRWRYHGIALSVAASAAIVHRIMLTRQQLGHWQDRVSLWLHTLACISGNSLAHNYLGNALADQGKLDEAIQHYQQALQLKPDYAEADSNLAWVLATCSESQVRNPAEALRRAQRARELTQSAGHAGGGSGGQRGFRPGGCDRNPSAGIGQSSRQSYFGAADSKPAALELSRPALLRTATGRGVETAVTQVKWVN